MESMIPLRSDRVRASYKHEQCLLSSNSRRQLLFFFESKVVRQYGRVERLLRFRLLKGGFARWMGLCHRKHIAIKRRPHRLLEVLPDLPLRTVMRRGLSILIFFLDHLRNKLIRRSFSHWKDISSQERQLMSRMLRKWSVKAAVLKLNRMNGESFARSLRRFVGKTCKQKLISAFISWKKSTELWRGVVKVKLLFSCWKLTTKANKKLRIAYKRMGLRTLHQHAKELKARHNVIVQKLHDQISIQSLKRSLKRWLEIWRKRVTLRSIISSNFQRGLLRDAFIRWKVVLSLPVDHTLLLDVSPFTPTKSNEPTKLSSPSPGSRSLIISSVSKNKKGVYLDSGGSLVCKQVIEIRRGHRRCASPYCSHSEFNPKSSFQSPNKTAVFSPEPKVNKTSKKQMTLSEKAKVRMMMLKKLNQEYSERELMMNRLYESDAMSFKSP